MMCCQNTEIITGFVIAANMNPSTSHIFAHIKYDKNFDHITTTEYKGTVELSHFENWTAASYYSHQPDRMIIGPAVPNNTNNWFGYNQTDFTIGQLPKDG